jgi:hypothetical protein
MTPGIPKGEDREADDAAVTGHSPFPDAEKNKRVMEESFRIVKEHVSEPPSDQDAKESPHGDKIGDLIGAQIGVTAPRQLPVKQDPDKEPREVGEPVPTQSESPELHEKGT